MAHIVLIDQREVNGGIIFIEDEIDSIYIFENEDEAKTCVEDHSLCDAYPHSIIDLDKLT